MADAAPKVLQLNLAGARLRQSAANPPAPPDPAAAQDAKWRSSIERLMGVEAEARRAASLAELRFLIANETGPACHASQIFVFTANGEAFRISAISGVSSFEANAPRLAMLESVVAALSKEQGLARQAEFALPAYCPPEDGEHKSYPFRFLAWNPLLHRDGKQVLGGVLLARDAPWSEANLKIAARLSETYAHAWLGLVGKRGIARKFIRPKLAWLLLPLLALAGAFPVTMTVLAPAQIVSSNPVAITAPIDGVVEAILVDPNTEVSPGTPLVRMSDVALRNEMQIAEEEVTVAQARLRLVEQSAVGDPKTRRELAIQRAELKLKTAARDYAGELLERTVIRAPSAGAAVYSDKRDWAGRPVSTGERILELADPSALEFEIDLPIADAIMLKKDAPLRVFLDADPLNPVQGALFSFSYEARQTKTGGLAYRLRGRIEGGLNEGVRLGVRGTAQISGGRAPLAFYLFRRPLAAMRQWLGR
jgi:HlyD family secretion protein/Biotin-lipoyl like